MWNSSETHLKLICSSSKTLLKLIWNSSTTHLKLIRNSSETHLKLIWHSSETHLGGTRNKLLCWLSAVICRSTFPPTFFLEIKGLFIGFQCAGCLGACWAPRKGQKKKTKKRQNPLKSCNLQEISTFLHFFWNKQRRIFSSQKAPRSGQKMCFFSARISEVKKAARKRGKLVENWREIRRNHSKCKAAKTFITSPIKNTSRSSIFCSGLWGPQEHKNLQNVRQPTPSPILSRKSNKTIIFVQACGGAHLETHQEPTRSSPGAHQEPPRSPPGASKPAGQQANQNLHNSLKLIWNSSKTHLKLI